MLSSLVRSYGRRGAASCDKRQTILQCNRDVGVGGGGGDKERISARKRRTNSDVFATFSTRLSGTIYRSERRRSYRVREQRTTRIILNNGVRTVWVRMCRARNQRSFGPITGPTRMNLRRWGCAHPIVVLNRLYAGHVRLSFGQINDRVYIQIHAFVYNGIAWHVHDECSRVTTSETRDKGNCENKNNTSFPVIISCVCCTTQMYRRFKDDTRAGALITRSQSSGGGGGVEWQNGERELPEPGIFKRTRTL